MDIIPNKSRANPSISRRQNRSNIGDFDNVRALKQTEINDGRTDLSASGKQPFRLDTADIDALSPEPKPKSSWWHWLKPGHIRRNFSPRRFFKRLGTVGGALLLIVGGFLAYKLYFASRNIIDRDSGGALALQGNIDPSELNGEGDGRVNILLIGEGGEQHDNGSRLADTIIVLSVDPFNHEAALLSLPRDLQVDVPGQWAMKINAAYAIGQREGFSEAGYPKDGPGLMQKTVEQTLDIPIHYYVRVDFKGLEQAVAAVDGIDLNIDETICDYNISWEFGFDCIAAGTTHLNSRQALFYARTRNTSRADFDRGARQRQVLLALKDKIFSLGTFADPFKISSVLDAAGSHVRTNLQIGEMLRLVEIGGQISADKILSVDIVDYIVSANNGSGNYVPRTGNFTEIQRYVRSIFIDGFIKKEAASIDIFNGSGVASAATDKADELRSYGYVINQVANAPSSDYTTTRIYDLSGGSAPFTRRYLEQRFNTVVLGSDQLPPGVSSPAKFVIIIGKDATR